MFDPFEKAERWRSRVEELRDTADGMQEPDTRDGLFNIADGLDHHARPLEAMAIRLHGTGPVFRGKATEVVSQDAD